jgi:hypothetical protein
MLREHLSRNRQAHGDEQWTGGYRGSATDCGRNEPGMSDDVRGAGRSNHSAKPTADSGHEIARNRAGRQDNPIQPFVDRGSPDLTRRLADSPCECSARLSDHPGRRAASTGVNSLNHDRVAIQEHPEHHLSRRFNLERHKWYDDRFPRRG